MDNDATAMSAASSTDGDLIAAVQCLMEAVDAAPGAYIERTARETLFRRLIDEYELEEPQSGTRARKLSVLHYHHIAEKMVSCAGCSIERLMQDGSKLLPADLTQLMREGASPADDTQSASTTETWQSTLPYQPNRSEASGLFPPLALRMKQSSTETRKRKQSDDLEECKGVKQARQTADTRRMEAGSRGFVPPHGQSTSNALFKDEDQADSDVDISDAEGREDPLGALLPQFQGPSTDEIADHIARIYAEIKQFGAWLTWGTGVPDSTPADWVLHPSAPLESLFTLMLGGEWQTRSRVLSEANITSTSAVIHALTAAAVQQLVFDEDLPWEGVEGLAARFLGNERYWNIALGKQGKLIIKLHVSRSDRAPAHGLTTKVLVHEVATIRVTSEEFQMSTIRPIAKDLAETVWARLQSQLAEQDMIKVKHGQYSSRPRTFWQMAVDHLEAVFFKALILRGTLDAAPTSYTMLWNKAGTDIDPSTMQSIAQGLPQGRCQVGWSTTPTIMMRRPSTSELLVAVKGMVVPVAIED